MPRTILDDRDLNELVTREQLEERLKRIEIVEVDLSDYYTKEEVEAKLEDVEVDLSDYYTKEEVEAKLKEVEVDLSDYYTKEETKNEIKNAFDTLVGEILGGEW